MREYVSKRRQVSSVLRPTDCLYRLKCDGANAAIVTRRGVDFHVFCFPSVFHNFPYRREFPQRAGNIVF